MSQLKHKKKISLSAPQMDACHFGVLKRSARWPLPQSVVSYEQSKVQNIKIALGCFGRWNRNFPNFKQNNNNSHCFVPQHIGYANSWRLTNNMRQSTAKNAGDSPLTTGGQPSTVANEPPRNRQNRMSRLSFTKRGGGKCLMTRCVQQ